MDYEKKYNEAINRAKAMVKVANSQEEIYNSVITIFPELKESEDERIRKELLDYCKNKAEKYPNDPKYKNISAWILWLEKQGTPNQTSIWKHWKDGIAGNGKGKLIYLIKDGDDYRLSSSLGYECDYIVLSDLDKLMLQEKQEYIHKDIFIDRITKYLYENNEGFILMEKDIEDFRKYLKNI